MLFFERIKRHGKWVFLVLVLTFAGGFVLGGVGGGGIGITDLLKNGGGGGGGSSNASTAKDELDQRIKDAEAAVKAKPQDASAWADLAEAAIQKPDATRAKDAADKARELAPTDAALAKRMANVYASVAADAQQRASKLQSQIVGSLSGAGVPFDATVVPGGTAFRDRFQTQEESVVNQVQSEISARTAPLQTEQSAAQKAEVAAWQAVVKATPDDGGALVSLAQVAQNAGDYQVAYDAFDAFLKLYPNDPLAGQVKSARDALKPYIDALSATSTAAATTSATTGADTAASTAAATTAAGASTAAASSGATTG